MNLQENRVYHHPTSSPTGTSTVRSSDSLILKVQLLPSMKTVTVVFEQHDHQTLCKVICVHFLRVTLNHMNESIGVALGMVDITPEEVILH